MMRYFSNNFLDESDEYLSHHGILGMKWGVRRYQNADGTLTSAGKAKYNADGSKKTRAERKKYQKQVKTLEKARKTAAKKQKIKAKASKSASQMLKNKDLFTTDEINKALDRFNTEEKLNNAARVQASNAKKWLDTAISYGSTAQTAYRLFSSNEGQILTNYLNDSLGWNLPTAPASLDQYNKMYRNNDTNLNASRHDPDDKKK